mmetsp:Transcript_3499/g.4541  ORF Transcript_3499/g.4541 Transcript_3499/m.4541 type:complete len:104 (+) Transcript_3499:51-362(+)
MVSKKSKQSDNINSRLQLVCKSGKYSLGLKCSIKAMRHGKCKLLVIAENCPPGRRSELEYYAMLSNTTVHRFVGNNVDLGTTCGKYFRANCMAITDSGDAELN